MGVIRKKNGGPDRDDGYYMHNRPRAAVIVQSMSSLVLFAGRYKSCRHPDVGSDRQSRTPPSGSGSAKVSDSSLCSKMVMPSYVPSSTAVSPLAVGNASPLPLFCETCDAMYRSSSVRGALCRSIREASPEVTLRHFEEFQRDYLAGLHLHTTQELLIAPDLSVRVQVVGHHFTKWYLDRLARRKVSMEEPWDWFPMARQTRRRIIYHCGPSNSGKTHAALQTLIKAKSGVYCAPLKALAGQVWQRIGKCVPCDLLIGDERRFAGGAEHVSCTVEMTPTDVQVDVGVIDEIQMIADRDRGWAWTRALYGLPARYLHLCGDESAIQLVKELLYKTFELRRFEVRMHERLVPLVVSESLRGDLRAAANGDCFVCFSRKAIFDMRARLERLPGVQTHIIYGAMPFEVREQQADVFNCAVERSIQESQVSPTLGDVQAPLKRHVLVSTDAIAYGLNMNIERILYSDAQV